MPPANTFTAAHRTLRNTTIRATLPTGKPGVFQVNRAGLITGLDEAWADHFRRFRDWQVEIGPAAASAAEDPATSGIPAAAYASAREALGRGIDSYRRTELDSIAKMIGIDSADLPNKQAVADEIGRVLKEKGE